MAVVRRAPVVMDELEGIEVRDSEGRKYRIPAGYRSMPVDLNAYIYVERVLGKTADGAAEALLGHVLTLEYLNKASTRVVVKSYKGDGLKVFVDNKEVFSWKRIGNGSSTVKDRTKKVTRTRARAAPVAPVVVDDEEFE